MVDIMSLSNPTATTALRKDVSCHAKEHLLPCERASFGLLKTLFRKTLQHRLLRKLTPVRCQQAVFMSFAHIHHMSICRHS